MAEQTNLSEFIAALDRLRLGDDRSGTLDAVARLRDAVCAEEEPSPLAVESATKIAQTLAYLDEFEELESSLAQIADAPVASHPTSSAAFAEGLVSLGTDYADAGAHQRAIPCLREALRIVRQHGPSTAFSTSLASRLADVHREYGEAGISVMILRQETDRARAAGEDAQDSLAELLQTLVHYLWQLEEPEEAIGLGLENVEIRSRNVSENVESLLFALFQVVLVYNSAGRVDEAAGLVRRSIAHSLNRVKGDQDRALVESFPSHLSNMLQESVDVEAAEKLLLELIKQCRDQPTPDRAILRNTLLPLADVYFRHHFAQEAEPLLREASELIGDSEEAGSLNHATVLNSHARVLMALARYQEAEPALRQALEIRRNTVGEDSPEYALSLQVLAELYLSVQRFRQAEEAARQSLALLERAPDQEEHRPFAMIMLGKALIAQGRNDEAEKVLQRGKSLEIVSEGAYPGWKIGFCNELAKVFERTGRLAEAVEAHDEALTHYLQHGGSDQSDEYFNLLKAPFDALRGLERHDEAYQRISAVNVHLESKDASARDRCPDMVRLGIACVALERFEEAEDCLTRALVMAEEEIGRGSYEYVSGAMHLIVVFMQTDRWREAEELARAAIPAAMEIPNASTDAVLTLTGYLARCCYALKKDEEGAAVHQQIIEQSRSVSEAESHQVCELIEALATESLQHGRKEEALALLTRAREIRRTQLDQSDPKLRELDPVIDQLRSAVAPEAAEGVTRLERAPAGYEQLETLSRCMNAFVRQDYPLCMRHAIGAGVRDVRTGLMLWLSLLHLDRADEAERIADAMQRTSGDTGIATALVEGLVDAAEEADVVAAAGSSADRCTACYFLAQRRLVDGDLASARRLFEQAITHGDSAEESVLEGTLARSALEVIDFPIDPSPTAVDAAVEALHASLRNALENDRPQEALGIAREARDQASSLGLEHPTYGRSLLVLAMCYDRIGESERAGGLMDEAVAIVHKAFALGHPEAQDAVDTVLNSALETDNIQTRFERSLSVLKHTTHDRSLLLTTVCLQDSLRSEDYAAMLDRAMEAVTDEPVFRAALRAGLGQITVDEALADAETDKDRCRALYLAGRWHHTIGDSVASRRCFERAIDLDVDCLEQNLAKSSLADDATTLDTRIGTPTGTHAELLAEANGLLEAGHVDDARRILERGVATGARGNPSYLSAVQILGFIYLEAGELSDARRLLLEAREGMRSLGITNSRAYLDILERLRWLSRDESGPGGRERLTNELVEVSKAVCGERDPRYAKALIEQALLLQGRDDDPSAIKQLQHASAITDDATSKATTEGLEALMLLGGAYLQFGEAAEGLARLNQCAEVIEANTTEESGRLWLLLASAFYGTREYQRAEEVARRAMPVFEARDDPQRSGYCAAVMQLADALQAQGRLDEALAMRNTAVEMIETACGDESIELGMSLGDLALTLDARGDSGTAIPLYERSIRLIHGLEPGS